MTYTPVIINGRFAGKRMTGVQRYAQNIASRLSDRCELIGSAASDGLKGHWWEQAALARAARGKLLWSPCNTGPLRVRAQVLTVHDAAFIDTPECFSRPFAAWYKWLVPRLVRAVRGVITVSEFSRQRIAAVCGVAPETIHVIPNGVDARFAPPGASAIAALREKYDLRGPYVLSLGSIEPRKNLKGLLAAWEHVAQRRSDVTLAVAGGGNLSIFRDDGKDLAALPGVKRLGYVPDELLPALYAGADVFAYPAIYEGFGLPPLEAMACGTAVVCSSTTSLPEVVGNAASLINPNDPAEIADAIIELLNDNPLRAAREAAGLRRAQQFSWADAAERTWSVLHQAAAQS